MAGRTFKLRAVVLRKTKLAEKDLVVTLLSEDGSLVKAVAKGARKPGGSLAARIELFSVIYALLAEGRTLHVLAEVRRDADADVRTFGLEQTACASPVAELVSVLAQEGLPQQRLFDMTCSALAHIQAGAPEVALSVCAAALWKVMAQSGFMPQFDRCAQCGKEVALDGNAPVSFSYLDGGVLCADCAAGSDTVRVGRSVLAWCAYLLRARFDDLRDAAVSVGASFEALHIARQWARVHCGRDVKSLDFLFTSGLF